MAVTLWVPALQSYGLSGALVFAPLALLLAANVVDLAAHGDRWAAALAPHDPARTLIGAALAGLAAATMYVASAALIDGVAATLQPAEFAAAIAVSLGAHGLLVAAVAAALPGTRAAARRLAWTAERERLAVCAVGAALLAVAVRRVVLIALDFGEWRAVMLSCAVGAAVVTVWMTVRVRMADIGRGTLTLAAGIVGVTLAVAVVPGMIRLADWDATLQKSVVLATWAALAGLLGARDAGRRAGAIAAALVGTAVTASAVGVAVAGSHAPRAERHALDVGLAVQRYATFDVSMRILLDVARPAVTSGQFLRSLRGIGEVTENPATRAVPIPLADGPTLVLVRHPDIFIIVVDSLRPDYLSPYNASATFTPAIGAFARDSIVMRRAFTPYGGTGLSEPALWAGGLIPRLMYPNPFAPINNLAGLLAAGRYRRYITIDEILRQTLGDRTGIVPLDSQLAHSARVEDQFKFDLCQTLEEFGGRLERDQPAEPVFFYSQPQNLHIRLLAADPEAPALLTRREDADRFFKPAVNVVRRLDGCFGAFVDRLKALGRYDDSIIVLTSDHGDAYGEEGRWGHAYYVAPEILRIPLILHVPEPLRRGRQWRPDAVAWSTDITPTLFELLGVTPTATGMLTGRPLLVREGQAAPPARERVLVQASYSRIFGLIDGDGRWLFTADGNRMREEFFDLGQSGPASVPMIEANRLRFERWLAEDLGQLNAHYGPKP